MRRLLILASLLGLLACASAPCPTEKDGGIGGTGACAGAPTTL
jgi:hypothetical protein